MKNKMSYKKITLLGIMLVVLAISLGVFFNQAEAEANQPDQGNQQAGFPVPVAEITAQKIQVWNDFSARLIAVNKAEIKPQVSGQITAIHFEDGHQVKTGDLLLTIDPRSFKALVTRAHAQLEASESQQQLSQLNYDRAKELFNKNAIAKRVLDERTNQLDIANNTVLINKAALIQAEVNLDHAEIRAPIDGRVSRPELTIGNLVQAGSSAPILTSIISTDRIYADFEVDDQTYMRYVHNVKKNRDKENQIVVRMTVLGGPTFYTGHIHSFDNQINPSTGTIRARAIFQNPAGNLLSGMFAKIQMASPHQGKQIVVPKTAIGVDQDRQYVFLVDDQNKAIYREVKVGQSVGDASLISDGLKIGDRIVVNGFGMVRPNMLLQPQSTDIVVGK